jgi:hypothetical protein
MSLVLTLHAHFLNLVLTTYFGELALAWICSLALHFQQINKGKF